MTKLARREKNQATAARMKAAGEERTTARCPVCYVIVHADYLKRGMAGHVCHNRKTV
jgi:hypothetical protein